MRCMLSMHAQAGYSHAIVSLIHSAEVRISDATLCMHAPCLTALA
jgi:hypothetical protein